MNALFLRFALAGSIAAAIVMAAGGLINYVYSATVMAPGMVGSNRLYEQSMAYGGGFYVASWMQVTATGFDPRVFISWAAHGSGNQWGTPAAMVVMPFVRNGAPQSNPLLGGAPFALNMIDPYVAFDTHRNRFLQVVLDQNSRHVWLSYTNPAGMWVINGTSVSVAGGTTTINILPGTQPLLSLNTTNGSQFYDYPSVAALPDGRIAIGVADVGTQGAVEHKVSVSTYIGPDGTVFFSQPAKIQEFSPFCANTFRLTATAAGFRAFCPVRTVIEEMAPVSSVVRHDSPDGFAWSQAVAVSSFSPPASDSSPFVFPPFAGAGPPGEPARPIYLAPLLEVRGSHTVDDYSLAFPVNNNGFNNMMLCDKLTCSLIDPAPQHQFLGGTSINTDTDGRWVSYFQTTDGGGVDAKAFYKLSALETVAVDTPGLPPGIWFRDSRRCSFPGGCWSLGDYVHTAGNPSQYDMVLYPALNCTPFSSNYADCLQLSPQRLQSVLLVDPPFTALPNYTPRPLRFPAGSDLRRTLPAGPGRPSQAVWFDRSPRIARPAATIQLCPKPGPLPPVGVPVCNP